MMLNYLISTAKSGSSEKEAIHDPKSKLKIKVIDLVRSTFKPIKGEVRYFVTDGKKKIAFETEGYNKHKTLLILHMIAWYCMYLGLIKAQIHASWP